MTKETNIDSVWKNNTETIRNFLSNLEDYSQLCAEIAYILRKRLTESNIEVSSVTNRAKALNSFLEKIVRKNYADPFQEITDFAGVRVVYLYKSNFKKIEEIINKEFSVMEKVDKLNEKGTDRFGYGAVHYIVTLGKNSSGARYDDLKNLKCEIQVKTVLQDAWAIIDHHLVYKRESDIPSTLQRKLNSLAGLFETADDQYDSIRREREEYLKKLDISKNSKEYLDNELNLDTFISYLSWKFPKMELKYFDNQPEVIFNDIKKQQFKILREIDTIIEKYIEAVPEIMKVLEDEYRTIYYENNDLPSCLLVDTILKIDDPISLNNANLPPEVKEFIKTNLKKENLLKMKKKSGS